MRAIIFIVVLAVAGAAGYFLYQGAQDAPRMGEQPAPAPLPTAEQCLTENAVYEYNDDRRLELRFRRLPPAPGQTIELAEAQGRPIGNMSIVIRITSLGTEYTFNPVNEMRSGPLYQSAVTYWQGEGARVQVYLFDSTMHYSGHQLRNDAPAPGYIFMPDVLPRLYRDRVDQPPGVFRFQRCETPAAPAAAAPTP